MIIVSHKGDFKNTERLFKKNIRASYLRVLDKYGKKGVAALKDATPTDSGETAKSWDYEITQTVYGAKISWTNSNVIDGVPIAIIIQYGHGTKNGGYVQGRDYINPALKSIFDKLANEVWEEVIK